MRTLAALDSQLFVTAIEPGLLDIAPLERGADVSSDGRRPVGEMV
jgi:hypothetical protein